MIGNRHIIKIHLRDLELVKILLKYIVFVKTVDSDCSDQMSSSTERGNAGTRKFKSAIQNN